MRFTRKRGREISISPSPLWSRLFPALTTLLCAAALFALLRPLGAYTALLAMQQPFLPVTTQTPAPKPLIIEVENVDFDDDVSEGFRLEVIELTEPGGIDMGLVSEKPAVLIYHTHTTEAYRETDGFEYEESGSWRTHDESRNIVAVGAVMAETLREAGINVLHDTTDHEPPKLSTSYSRSVLTMERYREEYPSIQLYIDVHRDAYGTSESGKEDFALIDGEEYARMMFVVGTGEGATGSGFGEMPDFQRNYALAAALTESLESVCEGITRPIRVKTGRYNQHIGLCILIEVGHNANTFTQAINSAELFARVLAEQYDGQS